VISILISNPLTSYQYNNGHIAGYVPSSRFRE